MSKPEAVKNRWENKVLTVCTRCRQNLRVPISYKPLQVTCPKCHNSFLYNYLNEFGNEGEHYTKVRIGSIIWMPIILMLYLAGFIIFMAVQIFVNFPRGFLLPILVGGILFILAGILLIKNFIGGFRTFYNYLPIKLLVINRQGIIYFDNDLRAEECFNWSNIKSIKYVYLQEKFAGLIETKRTPSHIEFEVPGKGKVRVPPAFLFTDEQRLKIMAEILRHTNSTGFVY